MPKNARLGSPDGQRVQPHLRFTAFLSFNHPGKPFDSGGSHSQTHRLLLLWLLGTETVAWNGPSSPRRRPEPPEGGSGPEECGGLRSTAARACGTHCIGFQPRGWQKPTVPPWQQLRCALFTAGSCLRFCPISPLVSLEVGRLL